MRVKWMGYDGSVASFSMYLPGEEKQREFAYGVAQEVPDEQGRMLLKRPDFVEAGAENAPKPAPEVAAAPAPALPGVVEKPAKGKKG